MPFSSAATLGWTTVLLKHCNLTGFRTFISHLGFNHKIDIADNTMVPISGSVFIGTEGDGGFISTTCPLANAQVCLFQVLGSHSRRNTDNSMSGSLAGDREIGCVYTDDAGGYVFNAAIGTRVYPVSVLDYACLSYTLL